MTDAEIILREADANCDAGRALRKLVRALVDANLQEADDGETDEEYARKAEAETLLFEVATAATNGHRWIPGEEP